MQALDLLSVILALSLGLIQVAHLRRWRAKWESQPRLIAMLIKREWIKQSVILFFFINVLAIFIKMTGLSLLSLAQ